MIVRQNLADLRGQAGDPAGAVTEHEHLLADRLRVLGAGHVHTWSSLGNLAYWRHESGDRAGAVTASEQLLEIQQRVLGPGSPEVERTGRDVYHYRHGLEG
jgi:hypothetical protein